MFFIPIRPRRSPSGRPLSSPRRLSNLERLEDRSVPAGNVLAVAAGPTLTLTGDALNNNVRLLPGSLPNDVVVVGTGGTTVNGVHQQTFSGVENLSADLMGGNDTLRAVGLDLSAPSSSQILVDGNAGDDTIEFVDTTIHANDFVDVQIYGERVTPSTASGTSGDDTIRLSNSSFSSTAFVSVKIYGETNAGGVVTGGNDAIAVDHSVVSATGGFFHATTLEIYGGVNTSVGGVTSVIGGGNDAITVKDTTVSAGDVPGSFGNQAAVTIVGNANSADAFNPDTAAGAGAAATIGGGNATIAVRGTTVSVGGDSTGTSQATLTVAGNRNTVSGFPGATAAATIGGGDNAITVADTAVTATGGEFGNEALADVRGQDVQAIGPAGPGTVSTIGGGSDSIAVRGTTVTASGPSSDLAALVVYGEIVVAGGGGVSVIGAGNDAVKVRDVQVLADSATDYRAITIDTGAGNDRVTIAGSVSRFFTVHLGDGDDELKFNTNTVGEEASLDGGPGNDRFRAHDDVGMLVWFDFEDVHVTP